MGLVIGVLVYEFLSSQLITTGSDTLKIDDPASNADPYKIMTHCRSIVIMKFVIDTVELKKRKYVIDAYSEREAIDKMEDAKPVLQEIVSDSIFNIHTINEYE